MQALRIHEFGPPNQAQLENIERAEPLAGQVAIRIEAASVNPLDLHLVGGHMQAFMPVTFPYTPGTDVAGTVEAVGPLVTRFKPGDRVFGRLQPTAGGGFAHNATLAAKNLCAIPHGVSFEQAAALPSAAGTAWLALFDVGSLQAGQKVLIHAAAGGVGSFAVQFAQQAGAHVVGTASAANHDMVKALGADEVIDYRSEDFTSRLQDMDLVIDSVRDGKTAQRSLSVIRPGGKLLSLVDPEVKGNDKVDAEFVFFQHDAATLDNIGALLATRRLQVILDTIHPLEDIRAALQQVAAGHAHGKVVISTSR